MKGFIELDPVFTPKNYKIQKFRVKKSSHFGCSVFYQDTYVGDFSTGLSSQITTRDNGRTQYFFIKTNVEPEVVGTICFSFLESKWGIKYITLTNAPKRLFHSLEVLIEKCI